MKTHAGETWEYDIELDDVVRVAPIDNVLVISPSEVCQDGSPGPFEYPYPFEASGPYPSAAEPPIRK